MIKLLKLCLLGFSLTCSFAQALPVRQINGDGKLIGARNIIVHGTMDKVYDVEFVEDTCAALFNGCDSLDDFEFNGTFGGFPNPLKDLHDQVFQDTIYDARPELTFGCSQTFECQIFTPFFIIVVDPKPKGSIFINRTEQRGFDFFQDKFNDVAGGIDSIGDTGLSDFRVFARWTPVVTAVPEPGTVFYVGFVGLALLINRRNRSTQGRTRNQPQNC